jgi:hypothetical protein
MTRGRRKGLLGNPLSTRSFFFRKCFHENERERARQGAARKEEHERESGLKKLVQIK